MATQTQTQTQTQHIITYGRDGAITYYHTGGSAIYGDTGIDRYTVAYMPIGYGWNEPGAYKTARKLIKRNGWPVD